MKPVSLLLGAVVIILMMAAVLTAVNDFRMTEYEEGHAAATGGAETTHDITLSQDLFSNATYNAVVTSNLTTDAPIPDSYASATNVLTVTGLTANTSRLLTITYQIDALEDYFGAGLGARAWPLLLVLGVIGIIAGAVYSAAKKGD